MEPARSLKPARSGRALPGDRLVWGFFFFFSSSDVFSRMIWLGETRWRHMRSRRVSEPQLSRKEPEEPHLHRRSSNPRCHFRHRGGASRDTGAHELLRGSERHARAHKKSAHITVSFTLICPVSVCDHRCIDLYMRHGWRFICSMAHNMDPDAPSPFYLQGAKPVWSSRWCDTQRAALVSWMCFRAAKCAARTGNPTLSLTGGSISISPFPVLTNTLFFFLNKGWLHT